MCQKQSIPNPEHLNSPPKLSAGAGQLSVEEIPDLSLTPAVADFLEEGVGVYEVEVV